MQDMTPSFVVNRKRREKMKMDKCVDKKDGVLKIGATNLSEYVKCVDDIRGYWEEKQQGNRLSSDELFPGELIPWFRGNTRYSHILEPTLLRTTRDHSHGSGEDAELIDAVSKLIGQKSEGRGNRDGIIKIEAYMNRRFSTAGVQFLNHRAPPSPTGIQWMMLMQHNGLPTRLLDWSKSALIALYYAIKKYKLRDSPSHEKDKAEDIDSCVWVLAPRSLQEMCHSTRKLFTEYEDMNEIDLHYNLNHQKNNEQKYPLPFIPSHVHERIIAQQARFTLHTHKQDMLGKFSMDFFRKNKFSPLAKIRIPYRCQPELFRSLRLMGITEQEITPSLDSISIEIKQRLMLGEGISNKRNKRSPDEA